MKVARIVIAGAAALAACGVLGMAPAAAQVRSAPAATWTKQTPATSPPPRILAAMAYDAATGTVVLFGGEHPRTAGVFGDTWTWDGTTWAEQAPAASPGAQAGAAMAYDPATGTVVLLDGSGDTWTWDGTTWTQQAPAASPPPRVDAAMAYDAATGTVVLFGGYNGRSGRILNDTWTWDGTTWTEQAPAASPPGRYYPAMAYDAATGTVVLFGGNNGHKEVGDTWTWDGTTWTQQAPAASPPPRDAAAMAYDAATGTVVLFGGAGPRGRLGRTWTWDGTTWTQQAPAASPPPCVGPAMAYDAATGSAVMFGGAGRFILTATWTWG